jgi:MoaA/NifB/PqqE/SkfB family radical SAM enzyme
MSLSQRLSDATHFARHRLRELHPFEVQALLQNACDLKCQYCKLPEMRTRVLSTAQWKEVIAELARLGTRRLKFQGGEPTLRHDFRELCAEARRRGILTSVISNGQRIADDPGLLDELDEVCFSVDAASAELHDRHRGAGSHDRVMRAIDHARARGLPTFAVMVVSRLNRGDLEALLRLCETRGVWFHAQPVVFGLPFSDDGAARELALTNDEVRALHRQLAAWKRAGRRLVFSAASYQHAAAWPDYAVQTVPSPGPSRCMAGRFYVHIEPNGDVHPCNLNQGSFRPKNLVRDGLEEALRNARHHDCGDCFTVYLNERKALFGLRPHAVRELFRRS